MTSTNVTRVDLSTDPVADGKQADAALTATPAPAAAAPAPSAPAKAEGGPPPDGGNADVPAPPTNFSFVEPEGDKTPEQRKAEKLIDDAEVAEQLNKNGKFSQYFKDKLAKKGMDVTTIEMLEKGAIAARGEVLADFAKYAGGDKFLSVLTWAKENLPEADRKFYNERAGSKDPNERRAAARDLYARFVESGAAPAAQLDGIGRAYQGYVNPLGKVQTPEQMVDLLRDGRNLVGGPAGTDFKKHLSNAAADLADAMGIYVRAL